MESDQIDISGEVSHLFRHEYGKLVAVLTKMFGVDQIQLAEDVVQEAMLEALKQWTYTGIPNNAVGWIYKVAKYKAINIAAKEKSRQAYSDAELHRVKSESNGEAEFDNIFTDEEIADDQLRMIFTCCHSAISADSQVALTLKTLCGFSIPEIAKAFLTTEENINKRLVRARKSIKVAKIPFEVPMGKALDQRMSSVMEVIYLLFNEGYHASSGEEAIRYELCEEAIRLAEMVASHSSITNSSQLSALLALMTFNASRFSARSDQDGNMLDLEHQDRSQWDQKLIQKGLHYLGFSTQQNEVSIYHILATISANHCTAADFESTDWTGILSLYDNLILIDNSPIVQLNRAVAVAKTSTANEALQAIHQIKDVTSLQSYLPYYTVRAELYIQNKDINRASELLREALELPLNEKVKLDIMEKLQKLPIFK